MSHIGRSLSDFQHFVLMISIFASGVMVPDEWTRKLRFPAAVSCLVLIYLVISGYGD